MDWIKKVTGNFSKKRILLLIFIGALSLRIFAVFHVPAQFKIPRIDAQDYDTIAINLLNGKGYSLNPEKGVTSLRLPLYPLFLAFIYLIFGHNYVAVRIIQSIMGALLCIIIYYIGKKAFNERIGLFSAAALALYQPYILYGFYGGPGFLYSENLFTFLNALLVFFLMNNLFKEFSLKNGVITGILLGLLVLARPFGAFFPLFLAGLVIWKFPFKEALGRVLVMFLFFILTMSPWIIRNYIVHKAFVPFSTMSGFVLFANNNAYTRGSGIVNVTNIFPPAELDRITKMPEIEQDRFYRNLGIDYISKNYRRMPKLMFKKLLCVWDLFQTYYDNGLKRIYNIWYAVIFMFGLVGIIKTIQRKLTMNNLLLLLLFLYVSFMTVLFSGDSRLRYYIEPFLIIFACEGVFAIYNYFKNKVFSYSIIGVVIGINLLLYAYSDSILEWVRHSLGFMINV